MKEHFKVDFFIVGAARCGTTSLYNYLVQHPDIFLPKIKELNFFSEVDSKDKTLFDNPKKNQYYHSKIITSKTVYQNLFSPSLPSQINGDISPSYMYDKNTAYRIYEHNPKAKIIISLRNPVQRAFSHYVMNYSIGQEKCHTFKKALQAPREKIWGGGNLYIELSEYYDAVKPYYELFDKENIKLILFEDWTNQKELALKELFTFLNVNSDFDVNLDINKNQKVSYKNIKTLNFLRNPRIKKVIDLFLQEETKDKWKKKLFKAKDLSFKLDDETDFQLKKIFFPQVKKLEKLVGLSLIDKWGLDQNKKISPKKQ